MPRSLLLLMAAAAAPFMPASATGLPGAAFELIGEGAQIYVCSGAGAEAWKLKAPDAVLRDAAGRIVGHHYAGPTWEATDGSKVVGAVLTTSAAPDPGSIPWLLLRGTASGSAGRFTGIVYITRTRTRGGLAPAAGCDAEHQSAEIRAAYSATYTFFTTPPH